jgi:transposase-like protein
MSKNSLSFRLFLCHGWPWRCRFPDAAVIFHHVFSVIFAVIQPVLKDRAGFDTLRVLSLLGRSNIFYNAGMKDSKKEIPILGHSADVDGASAGDIPTVRVEQNVKMACPHCGGAEFVRRGTRKKKHEKVQLYKCKNPECGKTFTDAAAKGRRYPLKVIIDAISYYNLGFSREKVCGIIHQLHKKIRPEPETISRWADEYASLCSYSKMRQYGLKMYGPMEVLDVVTMAHHQLYRFRYHKAKIRLMMEDYKNRNFFPLKEYLDAVSSETPHQFFSAGERISDVRSMFSTSEMIVTSKSNYANRLAEFALKGVSKNKDRHEGIQKFMIANDSVTVATEVPVYIRREDIEYMQNNLQFQIIGEEGIVFRRHGKREGKENGAAGAGQRRHRGAKTIEQYEYEQEQEEKRYEIPEILTGHVDIVQVRNGQIHLLDYKPKARKEKPIEQLTWYALALSRLTGLKLYEFKCAWFDETDYFEFYPLHVVKKIQNKKKRSVRFSSGAKVQIPAEDVLQIVRRHPGV